MKSLLSILALLSVVGTALGQDDPCAAFSWNVAHERQLFAGNPLAASAGATQAKAPELGADRLYELQLNPLAQVTFAATPGKSKGGNGPYAGLARLRVPQAGTYRISLDQPAWIDVIADGQPLASSDYQGRPGCHAPHKIVQFPLPANKELLIQLSGTPQTQVRLTITRSADSTK